MKKVLCLASVCAGLVTASAAFAGPAILGPGSLPVSPRVQGVPVVIKQFPTNVLAKYRQFRSFCVSRLIVR